MTWVTASKHRLIFIRLGIVLRRQNHLQNPPKPLLLWLKSWIRSAKGSTQASCQPATFLPLKRPKPFYQYDQSEQVALDIMGAPVLFSRISDTPVQMKTLMNEHEIHHLVIVDRENVVIGILHAWQLESLILRCFHRIKKHHSFSLAFPFLSTTTNTPLGHIAQAMLQSNQDVVLVSENHEIVGLITTKISCVYLHKKPVKALRPEASGLLPGKKKTKKPSHPRSRHPELVLWLV